MEKDEKDLKNPKASKAKAKKAGKKAGKKAKKAGKKTAKVKVNGPALDAALVSLKDIPELPSSPADSPDAFQKLKFESDPDADTLIIGDSDHAYVRDMLNDTERYVTKDEIDRSNQEIAQINQNFKISNQVQATLSYRALMKAANDLPHRIVGSIVNITANLWRYQVTTDRFNMCYSHSTLAVELDLDYESKECKVSHIDESFTRVDYLATFKDLDTLYAAGKNGQTLCNWLARTIHDFYTK